jgi:sugar phosphate isomerase/epimerase
MLKGISTQLFLGEELTLDRLKMLQDAGFDRIEILAIPPHFDYRNKNRVQDLAAWLRDQGTFLHSIHTPFSADYQALQARQWFSIASVEQVHRQRAVDEIRRALELCEKVCCPFAVLHMGAPGDPCRLKLLDALYQSLEILVPFALARGTRIALENIPGQLSLLENIRRFLEEAGQNEVGICFDTGHSNLTANPVSEIDAGGTRITTTHLHDSSGRGDDHLPPFEGTIPWQEVVRSFERIGYSGCWMLEVKAGHQLPQKVLHTARRAFDRLETTWEQAVVQKEKAYTPSS